MLPPTTGEDGEKYPCPIGDIGFCISLGEKHETGDIGEAGERGVCCVGENFPPKACVSTCFASPVGDCGDSGLEGDWAKEE